MNKVEKENSRLPLFTVCIVIIVSCLPYILNLFGADFGTYRETIDPASVIHLSSHEITEVMFNKLSGAFTHTILEWSAFCITIFTFILAFIHFRNTGNITTPIIGVALFCAGSMDAFHTLAADRLIEAVADNRNLIPFTWAICRLFNVLIKISGIIILLVGGHERKKGGLGFVFIVSLIFGIIAYGIIHYCATSGNLPQTMFPESIITRPYDVAPLLLFVLAGVFIFPAFYRKDPSLFSYALIISVIPEVVTQMHMAFGSTALFDNHFNIAHFLKIIAYLVPFAGLSMEFVWNLSGITDGKDYWKERGRLSKLKRREFFLLMSIIERQRIPLTRTVHGV